MKIYWASPLFNNAEIFYNAHCVNKLRHWKFDVILPQEEFDFKTVQQLYEVYKGMKSGAIKLDAKEVFEKCYKSVMEADVVIANLMGFDADSGTVVEATIGHLAGKKVFGLKEDAKSFAGDLERVNFMVQGVCNMGIFYDLDSLADVLIGWRS